MRGAAVVMPAAPCFFSAEFKELLGSAPPTAPPLCPAGSTGLGGRCVHAENRRSQRRIGKAPQVEAWALYGVAVPSATVRGLQRTSATLAVARRNDNLRMDAGWGRTCAAWITHGCLFTLRLA